MRATCCQDGAVSLEALTSNHNHTITELTMETLVVQLFKNVLKVVREVHDDLGSFNPGVFTGVVSAMHENKKHKY